MKKDSIEIKTLLENVKDLLSSTLKKNNTEHEEVKNFVTYQNEAEQRPSSSVLSRASSKSTKEVFEISEPLIGSNSMKLNDYLSQHSNSFEGVSSTSFQTLDKIAPINSTPKSKREKAIDTSSVYSIDYTSDIESVQDSFFELPKEQSLIKPKTGLIIIFFLIWVISSYRNVKINQVKFSKIQITKHDFQKVKF